MNNFYISDIGYDMLADIHLFAYLSALCFFLFCGYIFFKKRAIYFLSPLFLTDIFFYQSALLPFFLKRDSYPFASILLLLSYFLPRLLLSYKTFNFRGKSNFISKKMAYVFLSFNLLIFLLVATRLLDFRANHTGAIKIYWSIYYPILNTLFDFCLILTYTVLLHTLLFMRRSKYILYYGLFCLGIVFLVSLILSQKSFFFDYIMLLSLYLLLLRRRFLIHYYLIAVLLFLGILGYYYNWNLYSFMIRFLSSADGTFIILSAGFSSYIQLEYPNLVYFLKFFFTRFFTDLDIINIGNFIGTYSGYYNSEYGGPNIPISLYYFLGNRVETIIEIIFFSIGVTFVSKHILSCFSHFPLAILFIFLYIRSPVLVQSPTTFFLSLTKFLIVYLIFILLFWGRKKINFKLKKE